MKSIIISISEEHVHEMEVNPWKSNLFDLTTVLKLRGPQKNHYHFGRLLQCIVCQGYKDIPIICKTKYKAKKGVLADRYIEFEILSHRSWYKNKNEKYVVKFRIVEL